ncbi:M90 family metallopeptidase [Reichenbachiella agarivorans]|uniref:M90 family metallopeptidase n=1 Tax=Reichenbachiella agarivorans TaxID=2979464 RepID=A0ABY6CMS6_9BACT|nr:M90 family metallopeptidase [Reichenbachiella agarivorans]UXP31818.1 M90 family metallopeptidase [Reichenbachiella agarivorans]
MNNSFPTKLFLGIAIFVSLIVVIGVWRGTIDTLWLTVVAMVLVGLGYNLIAKNRTMLVAFDPIWRNVLMDKVKFYVELDESGRQEFEKRIVQFFSAIRVSGVDFAMDDECRLLVASSSIVPFWDLPQWQYGQLQEVLVYSSHFDENYEVGSDHHILGMVGSGGNMAHVMLLSKPALYLGFENNSNKHHVGFHEFAHLLDKSDGEVDGIPELFLPKEMVNPWTKLVHREITRIKENHSDVDPYGATSDAEFFAVISEYYHKRPEILEKKHPDLFKMLQMIYHPQSI